MATTMLRGHRRRTTRAVCAVATLALLPGCASSGTPADSLPGGTDDQEPSGVLEILVSSADASDDAFEAINAAFEEEYPDVDINFSSVPNAEYPAAQSSRLTAGNVDILFAQPREVPSYASESMGNDARLADSGAFLDLTDQAFMGNYTPSVLAAIAYGGRQYAVPTGLSYSTGVYYNKSMFDELGLSVPTTWSEFLSVAEELKANGITPLGIGGQDGWTAGLPMSAAVQGQFPTTEAKNEFAGQLWNQEAALTDAKPLAVMKVVEQVFALAQPGFGGVPYSSIPAGFAAGEYAMTPDGTWNQPVIAQAVGSAFDIGYFPLPTSENAADNQILNGKVELRLAVASSTENETAALAYLEFFSDPENYTTFVELSGFAPAQPDVEPSEFLTSISQYTGTFAPSWDQLWTPNTNAGAAALQPFDYPAIAPLGTKTAEEAAADAQEAWAAAF